MNLGRRALLFFLAALNGVGHAQSIVVSDAWARHTVPGQMASAAFMRIRSDETLHWVAASSTVAGVVEIHEMKLQQNVMKMSALPQALTLPAGQTVELKPGGLHIMLMDLKNPLRVSDQLKLTLTLRDARGRQILHEVEVPVRQMAPSDPRDGR